MPGNAIDAACRPRLSTALRSRIPAGAAKFPMPATLSTVVPRVFRTLPDSARIGSPAVAFHEEEIEGSVAGRLERAWKDRGACIAVRGESGALRFDELDAWAGGVATMLGQVGAGPPEAIALLLPDDAQIVAAMLGVVKAGGYFVPLDPRAPAEYVGRILKTSGARVLVTSRLFARMADALGPLVEHTVLIEQAERVGDFKAVVRGPDSPFSLHFTSGSTGEPKGVLQTNRVLLADIWRQSRDLAVSASDRFGWMLPAISTSSLRDIFGALLTGAELQPLEIQGRGFREISHQLRAMKTTLVHLTPTLFRPLAAHWASTGAPGSLRVISLGSEPVLRMDFELFRRHVKPPCVFQQVYGSTETRVVAQCFLTHDSEVEGDQVPAGWPVWGKEVRILAEEGEELPAGDPGVVCIRSRYLPSGYWNGAAETAANFRESPLIQGVREFVTGDCGRLNVDGMLELRGRRDSQVKIRGNRVDLLALEARLLSHPWIKEVAAAAHSEGNHRDVLAAYLVLERHRYLRVEQVRGYVAEALPSFMVPSQVCFLERLPRLPGGKLDRRALPGLKPGPVVSERPGRALSRGESEMAAIWAEVLGFPEVPVDANFFDLGGDSILAASLVETIRERQGRMVSLRQLSENATVEALTASLASGATAQVAGRLVHLNAGGEQTPLYLLPGRRGGAVSFRRLSELLGEEQPMTVIEYRGTYGEESPDRSIEAMASSAIADLRASGARGPYRLGGASVGGVVAFEMARQLRAAGESVECVLLLDTRAPAGSVGEQTEFRSSMRWLRRFLGRRGLGARLRAILADGVVEARLVAGRTIPGEQLRRYRRRHFGRVVGRYRPEPVSVPLILFRAYGYDRPKASNRNTRLWESLTTASLEIRDVRGSHVLIREPHVRLLAAEMQKALERVNRPARGVGPAEGAP